MADFESCFFSEQLVQRALLRCPDAELHRAHRDEVKQVLAGGMQALAEDLLCAAAERALQAGRRTVSADDVEASMAAVLFDY